MNLYDEIIEFLETEKDNNEFFNVDDKVYEKFQKNINGIVKPNAKQDIRPRSESNSFVKKQELNPESKAAQLNKTEQSDDYSELSFESLRSVVENCQKCDLSNSRKNVVFGEGNIHTEIMFIGEGPGRDEDLQGRPFVGKSGQLLTKMIAAMGYERSDVYIANIVKCRPPLNRNPNPEEAKQCIGYINRQIEIIGPKVIVLLGAVPLFFLLGKSGIKREHGKWYEYNGIKTLPTFHPAFLLRDPTQKRGAWEDLKKVMRFLGKLK